MEFIIDFPVRSKRCVCPGCSRSISIIALMRSLKAKKVKCSVCGTEVYAKTFLSYWLLDKSHIGGYSYIKIAFGFALLIFGFGYFWVFKLLKNNWVPEFAIIITFMSFLLKGRDITKQYALQFFSTRKSVGLVWIDVVTALVWIGVVWILINGLFLIAYTWATNSMPIKEETYNSIIDSGRLLESIELFFIVFLWASTPAIMFFLLLIIVFQKYIIISTKNMKKMGCYGMIFAAYLTAWIAIFPVKITTIVTYYTNKSFTAEIDQRTQSLSMSIESFINDRGQPPDSLQELFPDYMDSRAVKVFEEYPYDYRMISVDGQKFSVLYVPVYCGEDLLVVACKMVRLYGRNNSHFNTVEILPYPYGEFWDGRRLKSASFSNKNQNWSYYAWDISD